MGVVMISEEGRIREEGQRDHNLLAHNVYVRLFGNAEAESSQ